MHLQIAETIQQTTDSEEDEPPPLELEELVKDIETPLEEEYEENTTYISVYSTTNSDREEKYVSTYTPDIREYYLETTKDYKVMTTTRILDLEEWEIDNEALGSWGREVQKQTLEELNNKFNPVLTRAQ